jgi:hypothetical protein
LTTSGLRNIFRKVSEIAAIRRIKGAARKRAIADQAKRKATDELRGYCREAQKQGIPVARIATEAELSRQGVYDLLRDRAPSPQERA